MSEPEPTPKKRFPTVRISEISEENRPRWLIEKLWGNSGCGGICGLPKSMKSWLGLDMAISVASGTACIGTFPVIDQGRVLIYLAEDSPPMVKDRVSSIARHRGLPISGLDLHAISTPRLRLDSSDDCLRLLETVDQLRPRLLLLDPLVRLHSANENSAQEISVLLSYLRDLQRSFQMAVVVIHHARKSDLPGTRAGQGVRGSGDLWAFGDTNLYLRHSQGSLVLSVEHRSAPTPDPVALRLVADDPQRVHLEVTSAAVERAKRSSDSLSESVLEVLRRGPMTKAELRTKIAVNNQRLGAILWKLESEGLVIREGRGWRAAS